MRWASGRNPKHGFAVLFSARLLLKCSAIQQYCLALLPQSAQISYGKTPPDLKRMRFQPIFGAEDDGGPAPAEDDKLKSGEISPFEADSDPCRSPGI